jgi:hypothetical protein
MPKKPRKAEEEMAHLLDFLAESVLDVSDEDLLIEAREDGEDPEAIVPQVTAVIESAVAAAAQNRRGRIRDAYRTKVASMRDRVLDLPATTAERLDLLKSVLASNPGLQPVLTLQHRDLNDLTESDIEGYLRKLHELGVLDLGEDSDH